MKILSRVKNMGITKLLSVFPAIAKHLIASYTPLEFVDIPWTSITKPLAKSKTALVTTAGIHPDAETLLTWMIPKATLHFEQLIYIP